MMIITSTLTLIDIPSVSDLCHVTLEQNLNLCLAVYFGINVYIAFDLNFEIEHKLDFYNDLDYVLDYSPKFSLEFVPG